MARFVRLLAALLLASPLTGCGGDGEVRHRISGKITLDGTPIPYGELIFTPDAAKKNTGPQGKAPIKDGRYDTASAGGMGISGGAVVIRVNGMTGPGGKTLCEYEIPFDLPNGESTKDIDVPGKDAHNANPKGPGPAAKPAAEI